MIFSITILKNYIVRCDFWSCRHFVDRLFYYCPQTFLKCSAYISCISLISPSPVRSHSTLKPLFSNSSFHSTAISFFAWSPHTSINGSSVTFFICYLFCDSNHTINTDISDGETPEILDACPSDFGCILFNFCLASKRKPCISE